MSEERNPSQPDFNRRELLRLAGISITIGSSGVFVPLEAAQHVHQAVADEKAGSGKAYAPKLFTAAEYKSLSILCDLIVPREAGNGGALDAGAPEFIDLLSKNNAELAEIYTGGLAWIDNQMKKRYQKSFAEASVEERTALLDLIAYKKNETPELAAGIRFFTWARKMTVDAYYSSKAGVKELGFVGNGAMSEFKVPKEALEYALKNVPIK